MILKSLSLSNFRNYTKADFSFSSETTIIVGPNGVGKSNLLEAVFLLATGKSFRADKEAQLIQFGKKVLRVSGTLLSSSRAKQGTVQSPAKRSDPMQGIASSPRLNRVPRNDETILEVIFADQETSFLKKKYLINGVAKRRTDFAGHLTAVLFTPIDLELVSGQPGNRRRFLDEVLEQVDLDYRVAHATYTKALRQRNALLEQVQETGRRNEKLFSYWDELLIKTGEVITSKREELIGYINDRKKDFFKCSLIYDKSIISAQRLEQYKSAEIGAGLTLVGPHRDDIKFELSTLNSPLSTQKDARYFASRGQQRLIVLEMKLSQIAFFEKMMEQKPLLLLDDIFSELDNENIEKVLKLMNHRQVIITTTHKEFIENVGLGSGEVIELDK